MLRHLQFRMLEIIFQFHFPVHDKNNFKIIISPPGSGLILETIKRSVGNKVGWQKGVFDIVFRLVRL